MPADAGGAGPGRLRRPGQPHQQRRARHPALQPLTDIFAVPAWVPLANVFSVGDVLIAVGVACDRRRDARRAAATASTA